MAEEIKADEQKKSKKKAQTKGDPVVSLSSSD
jgi:hypothetical protein